jgi:hypothetical protein
MKSAFCSNVVEYRGIFVPATRILPISGIYLIHESRHPGGLPALAINMPCFEVAGTTISFDSGVMVFGHRIDQSNAPAGRDFRSW